MRIAIFISFLADIVGAKRYLSLNISRMHQDAKEVVPVCKSAAGLDNELPMRG